MVETATPGRPRARALRGGHRHRGPLPAADGLEDVLRLLDGVRRGAPEQPRLPGLPRPSGRAPGHQQAGRRARPRHGPRHRGRGPAGDALGPQELLLPGPAQGLPDQPVRPAARVARSADVRDLGRAVHGHDHPGAPRGGHREARPPGRPGRTPGQPRRLQPVGRAADGDRHRARGPDRGAGAPLRRGAPAAAPLDRRLGRRHGARPAPGRGQRLAPAARHRAVRDPRRGQEHELVPRRRARRRVRDRPPGGRPGRRRAARPGDAGLVRGAWRDLPHAGQGDLGRLPLLPGARPAAAPGGRELARVDPGRAAGAPGGAARPLPGSARAVRLRRGRPGR